MKRLGSLFLAAVLATLTGCSREAEKPTPQPTSAVPSVLLRWHFLGSASISDQPGAGKLKEILALPASQRLVEQTIQKLARAPQDLVKQRINTAHIDRSPLFKPLVEDLLHAESVFELRGATNSVGEWALAIRLGEDRRRLWETNLLQLAAGWEVGTVVTNNLAGFSGWMIRKHHSPNLLMFARAGDWLLTGVGQDKLAVFTEFLARVQQTKSPVAPGSTNWLQFEADLPKLAYWLTNLAPYRLPAVSLAVSGRGESVRASGRMVFEQPLYSKLSPWEVPVDAIHEPLISFSAFRGINGWLAQLPPVARLGITPLADQYFLWGQSEIPFQTFAALIIQSPTNTLNQIAKRIPSLITSNLMKRGMGNIIWVPNRPEIRWEGLGIVAPFIRALPDKNPRLLLAGVWAESANQQRMPEELLRQFSGRNDLVHYGWEVTPPRMAHWRALIQLPNVLQNLPLLPPSAAGPQWFEAVLQPPADTTGKSSTLDWPNTITEVTTHSPREFDFVRSAPLGLAALELVKFIAWLDSPSFPLAGYQLPFRPDRKPVVPPPR